MEAVRGGDDVFQILKGEGGSQLRNLYLVKLSFRNEDEINIFSDRQKLRDFITSRLVLQEMLKGVLQDEMKGH